MSMSFRMAAASTKAPRAWAEVSRGSSVSSEQAHKVSTTAVLQQIRALILTSQTSIAMDVLNNLIDIDYIDKPLLDAEDWTAACEPVRSDDAAERGDAASGRAGKQQAKEPGFFKRRLLPRCFESNLNALRQAYKKGAGTSKNEAKKQTGLFAVCPASDSADPDDSRDLLNTPGVVVYSDGDKADDDFFSLMDAYALDHGKPEAEGSEPSVRRLPVVDEEVRPGCAASPPSFFDASQLPCSVCRSLSA
eukprot:TRINITY_DN39785_c0_g3_i1.p1 TRINITY_DN39785_c0_g3~~TRINITY_DN39785_c0_g3_i1.p1  ORF type:complete len:248 (-),score=42.96 TRINITY_DN39785_c0_g3_i1:99-842(-)